MAFASISPRYDSLYKFIAITGLIAMVSSFFFADRSKERYLLESAEHLHDIERVELAYQRLGEVTRAAGKFSGEYIAELDSIIGLGISRSDAVVDATEEARMAMILFAAATAQRGQVYHSPSITAWSEAQATSLAIEGKRRIRQADSIYSVARDIDEHRDSLKTNAASQRVVMDSLLQLVDAVIQQGYSVWSATGPIIQKIAVFESRYKRDRRISVAGTLIGLIFLVVGSSLWYTRLQRYQDVALKRNAGWRGRRSSGG